LYRKTSTDRQYNLFEINFTINIVKRTPNYTTLQLKIFKKCYTLPNLNLKSTHWWCQQEHVHCGTVYNNYTSTLWYVYNYPQQTPTDGEHNYFSIYFHYYHHQKDTASHYTEILKFKFFYTSLTFWTFTLKFAPFLFMCTTKPPRIDATTFFKKRFPTPSTPKYYIIKLIFLMFYTLPIHGSSVQKSCTVDPWVCVVHMYKNGANFIVKLLKNKIWYTIFEF